MDRIGVSFAAISKIDLDSYFARIVIPAARVDAYSPLETLKRDSPWQNGHALEGASNCEQYIEDAEGDGNEELRDFFQEAMTTQRELADPAKSLPGISEQGEKAGEGRAEQSTEARQ